MSARRGPARTVAAGVALTGVGIAAFVTFLAVAIGWDNRVSSQWVFLVAAVLLVPVGVLVLLGGVAWRLTTAVGDAREREAAVVAEMGLATTPVRAAEVQARATRLSWPRTLAVAALLSPLVYVVLGGVFGRFRGLVLLLTVGAAVLALLALTGWRPGQRRTSRGAWTTRGARPGTPLPPAVAARVRAEQAEAGFGTADSTLLWSWAHERLLAREAAVQDVAAQHGWTYRSRDLRAAADGSARNSLVGEHEGVPFLAYDRIRSTGHTEVDHEVVAVSIATDTVVQVPFPAAFRLAVVADTFGAEVRWGHFGAAVDLESGAFNEAYDVFCLDPYRARLVLNPAVMALFAAHPGLEMVLDRGLLRLTRPDALADPATLVELVGLTTRVARSAKAADVR